MVCKEFEELCGKFGSLSPHKRIDIMCGMLRMCLPPELRFIGSVVEDLAKKDYHFLREHEIRANSQEKLSEIKHNDPHALANSMALSLALLHSWNASCANIIFEILTSNLKSAFDVTWSTDTATRDVILLVLMMAKNHPAFTFYQKTVIGDHNERQNLLLTSNSETPANAVTSTTTTSTVAMAASQVQQGSSTPRTCICSTTTPTNSSPPFSVSSPHKQKVHICNIDVKQDKGHRRHDRKHEYRLQVTWSNGEISTVSKTFQELREFQAKLVKEFSAEASAHKQERKLPFLSNASSGTREDIISYTKQLTQQSQHILECDLVRQFFQQGVTAPPSSPAGPSCVPANPPVTVSTTVNRNVSEVSESVISHQHPSQPLVLQNSHLPQTLDNADVTGISYVPLKGQVNNKSVMSIQRPIGSSSPHQSPHSSNGASPSNSRSNSPGDTNHNPELALIQFLLSKLNLQKHRNHLEKYTSEQLCIIKVDELIQIGLTKEEALKLKAEAELIYREKMSHPPNGLIEGPMGPRSHPSPPMVMPLPHQLAVHPQGGTLAQPPIYPHMFIYSAFPPGPPGLTQTRDSSPTGSDYSSPSPSPRPQKKGTAILLPNSLPKNSDSSSDDNEKDKLTGMETGRHPSQPQVPSPMGNEDVNSVPPHPGMPSTMFVHGDGPPPPIGSGYQSDPTPSAFLPRVPSMITRPNYKAQPAHTNLNIPPKHVISMPPDGLKRNGTFASIPIGMAPPIPRSDGQTITTSVMTATSSSANSGFNFIDPSKHNLNWMPVPHVPGYQIRSPIINGNQRGFTCNVTNATSITMVTQSASCGTIHPGHPPSSIIKNSNSHGQLSVESGCGLQENIHSVAPLVQNSSPGPVVTSGCSGSHILHAATSQANTTCSSATCSSCGSPCGHGYPATYPYHTNSLPHPLNHAPFWHMSPHFSSSSNGLVPQMLRYPGIPYHIPQSNSFPNGITPDILSLNNHHFISPGVPTPFMTQRGSSGYYPYHTLVRQPSREEKSRKASCSNCGAADHNAAECRESSMEHFVGHFRLNYEPKSNSD